MFRGNKEAPGPDHSEGRDQGKGGRQTEGVWNLGFSGPQSEGTPADRFHKHTTHTTQPNSQTITQVYTHTCTHTYKHLCLHNQQSSCPEYMSLINICLNELTSCSFGLLLAHTSPFFLLFFLEFHVLCFPRPTPQGPSFLPSLTSLAPFHLLWWLIPFSPLPI